MRKYRVYLYSGQWYGECGLCTYTASRPIWRATLGLLELHAQDEHPSLTLPVS